MGRPGWIAVLASVCVVVGTAARADEFRLTSPDVTEGGTVKLEQVFKGFGCTGMNVSPALSWTGAPASAKSFALTVYDPDAPTGSGFWHWVLFNIPTSAHALPKDAGTAARGLLPAGAIAVRNDYGVAGYGGPCPPPGDKPPRYIFTVFAVDEGQLPIDGSVSPAVVGFNLHFHTVAKATLTGLYGR